MKTAQYPNQLSDLYQQIGQTLKTFGHDFEGDATLIECIGYSFGIAMNLDQIHLERSMLKDSLPSFDWEKKEEQELSHYNKLTWGLVHSFGENWFYKKEAPDITRRAIVTSSDCISAISLHIRHNTMYVVTMFRSSHYDRLLPSDMRFIAGIPEMYLKELGRIREAFDVTSWNTPQVDKVEFYFNFASLHGFKV